MMPRAQTIADGPLKVAIKLDETGRLRSVSLPKRIPEGLSADNLSAVIGRLEKFPLSIPSRAPFHQKAWHRMRQIPWGSALTYGELAAALGNPRASRAIGQACAANALPLIIPCHRVLAEAGMGGFAYGTRWKAKLLELESEPRPPF